MSRTPSQSKALFAIFRAQGIDDEQRADLCLQYTDGRSSSTRDLTYDEARAMLEALNRTSRPHPTYPPQAAGDLSPPGGDKGGWHKADKVNADHLSGHALNQLRRYLMSKAIEAGMYTHRQGRVVCDVPRLQRWIDKYGTYKMPLNSMDKKQLNTLVRQMEQYARKEVKNHDPRSHH